MHQPQSPPDWLQSASVPVLPPAVGYLLSILYDPDLSIKTLAVEVERFPSIAARVLAVANSPWSSPVTEFTRLPDACARLGLELVRTLSIALAVANTFDPSRCQAFDGERYWATALLAAQGATLLAEGMAQTDAALTWRGAALFHNIGLLWLADRYPQQTAAALRRDTGAGLAPAMRGLLGTDYRQAGAWLARAWTLPAVYRNVIEYHRDPDAAGDHNFAAATVGAAADIASTLYRGDSWAPDGASASMSIRLRPDLTESTYQSLSAALENVRAMGRTIATT